ncbi:MAG TPA: AAA family ATPase, partial [Dehalococcoidia bacterium]
MIGRNRELDLLCHHLTAAREGGAVALLSGEAGIGKTRLLTEFAGHARAGGWLLLSGRAHESEGAPPYLPLIEALREPIRARTERDLLELLGPDAAIVTRVFPQLSARLSALPPAYSLPAEHERYRLFEAISGFILSIIRTDAAAGGLLLLDDLHWADRASLLLLRHLLQFAAGAPLLVAGAYRSDAVDDGHPLAALAADLARNGALLHVALDGLSTEESGALVAALQPGPLDPALVEAIHREAGGNPFFVREIVRHLQATGRDFASAQQPAPLALGVPEGARRVIGQRLARLSTDAQRLVQAAAVLDAGCEFPILRLVSEIDEPRLLDVLDEVLHAGVLREGSDGLHFTHALIRETVYNGLSASCRQRLHLRAAEAIERAAGQHSEPVAAVMALHYRRAGTLAEPRKAHRYAVQAGEAAASVFAWEEAAAHWTAALDLLPAPATAAERLQRAAILERLGDVLYLIGLDVALGLQYLEEALALYETLGEEERAAAVHVRLGHNLMLWTAYSVVNIPRALGHFRTAEAWLAGKPESPLLGDLYTGFATAALKALQTTEGLATARRAVEIGARLHDERVRVSGAVLLALH